MNPILAYKLKRLGRRGKPSKDFVDHLGMQFVGQKAENIHRPFSVFAFRLTASLVIIVLLFGASTSTYAYASDEVTPDHPLYGVRQTIETVEEVVSITPARKQVVRKKHLERKQKEIEHMLERRPELKELPEGQALIRVENILKEGTDENREPDDVRDAVLEEIRSTENQDLRPASRERLRKIEDRLEGMTRLEESDDRD